MRIPKFTFQFIHQKQLFKFATRDNIVVTGTLFLILLLLGLLLLDGYIFYSVVLTTRAKGEINYKSIDLSEVELDNVLQVLGERRVEFGGILRGDK